MCRAEINYDALTSTYPRRVRLVRSPVAQFLVVGVLLIAAVIVGASYLADRAADDEALAEAKRINAVLANSVAEPGVKSQLSSSRAAVRT